MDMAYITLGISVLSIAMVIINFALNRKDKSNVDVAEDSYKMGVLENKIDNLSKQVEKILDKLDFYDKEIDEKIDKAIEVHIQTYHKGA